MKHFYRLADAAIQLLLLLTWVLAFVTGNVLSFYMYFITGGWQLLSLIIHFFISSQKFQKSYNVFVEIVIGVICFFLAGLFLNTLAYMMMLILFFGTPVLAIGYTYNCIAEIIYLRKRPISYLK